MALKILIIEDHEDFRQIVKDYLKSQIGNLQIFEAASGEAGEFIANRENPELILMDIRLPNANGIDTASRIKRNLPECRIVILTMFETDIFRNVFKSDDINAYLGKSELYEKLIPIIKKLFPRLNNGPGKDTEHSGTS